MRRSGMSKTIDELGRFVVPKEIRDNLNIKEHDLIDIEVDENDNIVLKKKPHGILRKLRDLVSDVRRIDADSPIIDMLQKVEKEYVKIYGDDNE